jgi:hypothetical protein
MEPNDPNVLTAWNRIKSTAPRLWEFARPILSVVIAEEVKKRLGL